MVVMTPPRESWTDECLDDLKAHMDAGLSVLESHMDARFSDLTRSTQILFGVIGTVLTVNTAMLVGVIGLLATRL